MVVAPAKGMHAFTLYLNHSRALARVRTRACSHLRAHAHVCAYQQVIYALAQKDAAAADANTLRAVARLLGPARDAPYYVVFAALDLLHNLLDEDAPGAPDVGAAPGVLAALTALVRRHAGEHPALALRAAGLLACKPVLRRHAGALVQMGAMRALVEYTRDLVVETRAAAAAGEGCACCLWVRPCKAAACTLNLHCAASAGGEGGAPQAGAGNSSGGSSSAVQEEEDALLAVAVEPMVEAVLRAEVRALPLQATKAPLPRAASVGHSRVSASRALTCSAQTCELC